MFPTLDTHNNWATTLPFPAERALRESIRHWRANAFGAFEGIGPSSCALCKLYIESVCEGCPVAAFSGKSGCVGTPYGRVECADFLIYGIDFRGAAREELYFLEMLLELAHASDAERGAAYCGA